MSRYQSRLLEGDLVFLLLLAFSSILFKFKMGLVAVILGFTVSIVVLNTVYLFFRNINLRGLLVVYSIMLLSSSMFYLLIEYYSLLGLEVGLVVVYILVFLVITSHLHVEIPQYGFTTPLIPVGIFASIVLGVFLGVKYTVLLVTTGLIDAFSSIPVFKLKKSTLYKLTCSLLVFTIIYSQPILELNLSTIIFLLGLHIARDLLIIVGNKHYTGLLVVVDVLLRPVVVTVV